MRQEIEKGSVMKLNKKYIKARQLVYHLRSVVIMKKNKEIILWLIVYIYIEA